LRDPRLSFFFIRTFLQVLLSWREKDAIPPTPTNKLAQLLKNQQVEYSTRCDFVIIVVGNPVPVKAAQGLRKRYDKRDG
jgi:hypothetical protein